MYINVSATAIFFAHSHTAGDFRARSDSFRSLRFFNLYRRENQRVKSGYTSHYSGLNFRLSFETNRELR